MKQRTNTTTVHTNIQDRQAFTIKATGKAFRSLIDGIYSNKILAPVRELMTNAYDAHLMAGVEEQPFQVTVPDTMQPEFIVRDFGIGMDHETVTTLYTTLFDSSKDQTNDQVGMLGLGSKSPFAYTDTFTVACYDGTTKRVYNAHLDNDVPQLGLMWEGESDEPRGVEVKFPVSSFDFNKFNKAIERVALGFDVRPEFVGGEIEEREVLFAGDGYRVFRRNDSYYNEEFLSAVNVRMGCVIYPVQGLADTDFSDMAMPRQVGYVIDVPIGASDVTTNREALADDDLSVKGISPFLNAALEDHRDSVMAKYNAATTRLEKSQVLNTIDYEWRRAFNLPLTLMVSLMNDGWDTETMSDTLKRRRPGYFVEAGDKRSTLAYEHRYEQVGKVEIIIDDDVTVRRRSRVRDRLQMTSNTVYVVPAGHEKVTVPRLKKLWGLKDEQFTKVEDLPDPGPRQRASAGARANKSDLQDKLDDGKPWVNRMRKSYSTTSYRDGGINRNEQRHLFECSFTRKVLGLDVNPQDIPYRQHGEVWDEAVVHLTDKQVETLEPNEEQALGVVLRNAWEAELEGYAAQIKNLALYEHLRHWLSNSTTSFEGQSYSDRFLVADQVLANEGYTLPEVDQEVWDGLYTVRGLTKHVTVGEVSEFNPDPQLVAALKEALRRQYPALFRLDRQGVLDYIQAQA